MRILYITNARIPTEKAHGLQIVKTLEALAILGNTIRLILPQRRNLIQEDLFLFYDLRIRFSVQYLRNPFLFLEKVSHSYYFSFQRAYFGIQAFFVGITSNVDVVYTRDITLAFFLSIFSTKTIVYEDHEPKRAFAFLQRLFLRSITKKVVVAQNLETIYKSHSVDARSYAVIPNGVDLADFDILPDRSLWTVLGIKENEKVVLYAGSFSRWKGVQTLVEALPLLPQDTHVVLLGAETNRDEGRLHKLAFRPNREVIKYLKSADCLVLPNTALEERSEKYTTPLKLFQYMASRVPIVASDIPSLGLYLKDAENAKLFKADDSKDLANAVGWLFAHPQEARGIAQKAREDVLAYTWDARAEKIMEFLST